MAEITSGENLTVLVLNEREARNLRNVLFLAGQHNVALNHLNELRGLCDALDVRVPD